MQTDFTDKDLDKRPKCFYCKLPINKIPIILTSEKIYFFRLINHPVHPECLGPYIDSLKSRVLSFLGIGLAIIALVLSIISLMY